MVDKVVFHKQNIVSGKLRNLSVARMPMYVDQATNVAVNVKGVFQHAFA